MAGRRITDKNALDSIQELLNGQVWTPDHLDQVAEIVWLTGRVINDPEDDAE